MSRRWYILFILVILGLFLTLLPTAHAAGSSVSVEVVPPTLQLAVGDTADVLFIITNGSPESINLGLPTWHGDPGLSAMIDSPPDRPITAGSATSISLHLTRRAAAYATSMGAVEIPYTSITPTDGETQRGVTVGSIEFRDPEVPSLTSLLDVQLNSAVAALDEQHPGTLFLQITNRSTLPMTITRITSIVPQPPINTVILQPPDVGSGVALPPGMSQTFPIPAQVADDRTPDGEHLVVCAMTLMWEQAGRVHEGSLSVSRPVQVRILAESDILKALGVPSLLLLPGFLVVATYSTLWTRFSPKGELKLGLLTTEFWVLAISLSLLAAPAYVLVTKLMGQQRDYLRGYGLRDIYQIWYGSVLTGVGAWSITIAGLRGLAWYRKQYVTPSPNDTPLIALQKAARRGVSYPFPQVAAEAQQKLEWFFLLGSADSPHSVWAIPAIQLVWNDDTDPTQDETLSSLNKAPSVQAVLAILAEARPRVVLTWKNKLQPALLSLPFRQIDPEGGLFEHYNGEKK